MQEGRRGSRRNPGLLTLLPGERQSFRFMEVCGVTTSVSPGLLINCRFVHKMIFESTEALQINLTSQLTLSAPISCWLVNQVMKPL